MFAVSPPTRFWHCIVGASVLLPIFLQASGRPYCYAQSNQTQINDTELKQGQVASESTSVETAGTKRHVFLSELDPEQAAAHFHAVTRRLRAEQRKLLSQTADELAVEFRIDAADKSLEQSDKSVQPATALSASLAARGVVDTLRVSTDFTTALLLVLQLRSQLSAEQRLRVDHTVDRLSQTLAEYEQVKAAYRAYIAASFQRHWITLTLDEKRSKLNQYFALANESHHWLLTPRPVMAHLPLPSAAKKQFQEFDALAQERLSLAERVLQNERNQILEQLTVELAKAATIPEQRTAMDELKRLLQADYGKGFRGLMLCEVDTELPASLQNRMRDLLARFQAAMTTLRDQHRSAIRSLDARLQLLRDGLLASQDFASLIALDIRLDEAKQILRPVRIYAMRRDFDATKVEVHPEDALLLDTRDGRYHVQFIRDNEAEWLDRDHVVLKPNSKTQRDQLRLPIPPDGPGVAAGENTPLVGSVFCISGNGWQPVTIVDDSPFGVVLQWHGTQEAQFHIQPRSALRVIKQQ